MMQQRNSGTPKIHKRVSSLPPAFERGVRENVQGATPEEMAPVPPLKVGLHVGRHSRSKSAQTCEPQRAEIGAEGIPGPMLRAGAPAIPKRHTGRNLVGLWLLQGNGRIESQQVDESGALLEEAPSLTSASSDGSERTGPHGPTRLHARHNCIRELYYSEKQYSRELSMAIGAIHKCSAGISEAKLGILLNGLPQIAEISNGLVTLLEQMLPLWILTGRHTSDEREVTSHVGRAMCIFLNGEMYREYERYICNHGIQRKMVKRVLDGGGDVRVRSVGGGERVVSLRTVLHRPAQRILEYPKHLKAILDQLPAGHVDAEDLRIAYRRSRDYCKSVDGLLGTRARARRGA